MSLNQKNNRLTGKYNHIHQDLIEACRSNDRKAQVEIYKLYYKAMYNTALRIVNEQTEAEDIMQEAFLDAFRKIQMYSGVASFGSWLKRIVINKAINAVNRRKETLSIEDHEIDIQEEQIKEIPFEVLSYKIDMIRKSIFALPDKYRIVLSLFLLEGYDHEEISQILNISYSAARTRYSRARGKLLKNLKDEKINQIV